MKPAHIEIHENEIIISNENRPIFILVSLVVLTIISLIIPIVATAIVLNEGDGLKFGLLISYLVGWGVALFFIRLILWNVFGKEVFQITNNSIEYYCSYKYFVDNHVIYKS